GLFFGDADVVSETLPDGRFAIRGFLGDEEVTLTAQCPSCLGVERIVFPRGQQDLRIVLVRAGTIAAEVLAGPGLGNPDLGLVVRPMTGEDRSDMQLQNPRMLVPSRAQVAWHGLAPGEYELVVRLPAEGEVRTISGLRVEAGAECADPRLH